MEPYQRIFQEQYDTVHRLETNKLRNVAKFFAHLLFTDAIEWKVGTTFVLISVIICAFIKHFVCQG